MSLDTVEQTMVQLDSLKSVKKAIGVKQATKAVEKDHANVIYIAEDADKRVTAPLYELCVRKNIKIKKVATMAVLGKACGIEVGAAAVAVLR